MSTDNHTCKFDKPIEEEVILTQGIKTAKDTIKEFACSCGQFIAYDLEREIL
jgi:hypothetical protein